jgi:hypothetical protein
MGLGGIMEIGEKTFEAAGECHLRLGVEDLCSQSRERGLDRRSPLAQGRHARPELIGRHQLLLVGFDQARDSSQNPGQFLRRDITWDVADMVGAQVRQPAINLGADQRGIAV